MIHKSELTIGSIVFDEVNQKPYKWRESDFECRTQDENYYHGFLGIKLNQEILEGCGFEIVNHVGGHSFYVPKKKRSEIKPHIEIHELRTSFNGYSIAHCDSLHLLQNLWRITAGKELEVKLPQLTTQ